MKKIAKTAAAGKVDEQMSETLLRSIIFDARDAEAAARMARVMMDFVAGEFLQKSTIGKACKRFENQTRILEKQAHNIMQMLMKQ